jgi:SSS family solute:Na+ symporter
LNLLAVTAPRERLELVDFVGVVAYLAITAAIVVWSSRRQKTTEDFFLGGRRMPWMAVGLSLLATLMSSISYLGVPGEMIGRGITMFAQYMALPFSMFVVLVIWVPFFMRLRMTSAYEYLEKRFDHRARLLGGLLFLLLRLGWMSMVMYVGSMALTYMTSSLVPDGQRDPVVAWLASKSGSVLVLLGLPALPDTLIYWVILAVGAIATIYTCTGGFRAAIWNDVLQSLMLLGGAIITLGYVVVTTQTGPADWWQIAQEHASGHTEIIWFSFDPTVRMTIFTACVLHFFWTICTHGSDQVVLQRYFSTKSLKAARRSYITNAMTDVTIGALLALCGLAILAFYLKNPSFLPEGIFKTEGDRVVVERADRVLPHFFAHQLPAGVGGVILAVLLCDAMQTLVSGVNSISAVFTTDIYSHQRAEVQKRVTALGLAKLLTVVVGIVVTMLGMAVAHYALTHPEKNIIDMMAAAFNLFLGPMASLFLIGMFLKCRTPTVLIASSCGMVISFLWSYWQPVCYSLADLLERFGLWSGWQELLRTAKMPSITLTTAVPYLSSFGIAFVLTMIFDRGATHAGLEYTWRSVMRRPIPTEDEL